MKKRRKRCGRLLCFLLGILAMLLFGSKDTILADSWQNAYDYYQTYGNRAVFRGTSSTDGYIYCGTRGVEANSGVKYRTIGWKINVVNSSGAVLQSLYVQLGGNYLRTVNTVQDGDSIYNLYAMQLSSLKQRMNGSAIAAMNQGSCTIVLDACMVVMTNGSPGGTMNDSGITSGRVYTSYDGIANAAGWTAASKEALHSYFNKSVDGLFYNVSVGGGSGIARAEGGGRYCYGTYVAVNAVPAKGYLFSHWSGSMVSYSERYGFYVNGNVTLIANGKPKVTEVTFCRNTFSGDAMSQTRQYTYGVPNQYFGDLGYTKEGYHQIGWSENPNASRGEYDLCHLVSSEWINDRYPRVTLYAVWEVNTYHVAFHGNGAPYGNVPTITANYEQGITMPQNGFAKPAPICTYLGWGHNSQAFDPDYLIRQQVAMKVLAKQAEVLYQDGATILLYAIWDYAPEIHTGDFYYSLMDAREGKITESELAKGAYVTDREDGNIPYGYNGKNSFCIINYDADVFCNMEGDDKVKIVYEAIDHVGNRVEEEAWIHVVDTTITSGRSVFGKIRFVDEPYFSSEEGLVSEELGGIKKDSQWVWDDVYRATLWESVKKANLP